MKITHKYILSALLFFCLIIVTYFISNKQEVSQVKSVFNIAELKGNCNIKELNEKNEKYNISVYFPESKYEDLNNTVTEKINKYISDFRNEVEGLNNLENKEYELKITFNSCEYEEYISYVFEIFTDLGGAHPSTLIWTISYDTKNNEVVDIKYLIANNKDILNIMSKYAVNALKENDKIKENYQKEMFSNGTSPTESNFSRFAFTKAGLKIYFEQYQIAPYSSGQFEVVIPYDELGIF